MLPFGSNAQRSCLDSVPLGLDRGRGAAGPTGAARLPGRLGAAAGGRLRGGGGGQGGHPRGQRGAGRGAQPGGEHYRAAACAGTWLGKGCLFLVGS